VGEMREGMDARAVLEKALEKEVAFIPGAPFFPCGGHEKHLPSSIYATMDGPRIEEGIARLAQVLREFLRRRGAAERESVRG